MCCVLYLTEYVADRCFRDANWERVGEGTKRALGLEARDDGEFWMAFKDFCHHFEEITLCLTGPDFDRDGLTDQAGWHIVIF